MSDIVERLRASRAIWTRVMGVPGAGPTELETEAADEIERLRKEREWIIAYVRTSDPDLAEVIAQRDNWHQVSVTCKHDWIDATNEVISHTDYCGKCGKLRSHSERPEALLP